LKQTRRQFCLSSAALVGLSLKADRPLAGAFVNDDVGLGHAIRDRGPIGPAKSTVRVLVVIVGGGMAGLSAAWRLHKKGFDQFVVLELGAPALVLIRPADCVTAIVNLLFNAIDELREADLARTITIRGEAMSVQQALLRSVTHVSYHVGQIVYLAKSMCGDRWQSLTIPRGQSDAFNARTMGPGVR